MIYFVDFEASSLLPGSFPIEVAWVDMNGQGESYLIRPSEEWLDDGYGWSHQSEAVHGISLAILMSEGIPIERVARRAADVLSSRQVVACSDAPGYDGQWMETLMEAAGERRTVRLLDVQQLYGRACRPLLELLPPNPRGERERAEKHVSDMAKEIVAQAQEAEGLRPRVQHRALPDAESLWRTWRSIQGETARRIAEGTPR